MLRKKLELNEVMRLGFLYDRDCHNTKIRDHIGTYTVRSTPHVESEDVEKFVREILKVNGMKSAASIIEKSER